MSTSSVERDRRVFVLFEVGQRPRAHALVDAGLYPQAVRGSALLAAASAPSVPLYWGASTVERSAFAVVLPGILASYCDGVDEWDEVQRVRYRDEGKTQLAAGYCVTQRHDGTKWIDELPAPTWLTSLGLVPYEPPAGYTGESPDSVRAQAEAADVELTQAERDALLGPGGTFETNVRGVMAALGVSPGDLRAQVNIGEVMARILAGGS